MFKKCYLKQRRVRLFKQELQNVTSPTNPNYSADLLNKKKKMYSGSIGESIEGMEDNFLYVYVPNLKLGPKKSHFSQTALFSVSNSFENMTDFTLTSDEYDEDFFSPPSPIPAHITPETKTKPKSPLSPPGASQTTHQHSAGFKISQNPTQNETQSLKTPPNPLSNQKSQENLQENSKESSKKEMANLHKKRKSGHKTFETVKFPFLKEDWVFEEKVYYFPKKLRHEHRIKRIQSRDKRDSNSMICESAFRRESDSNMPFTQTHRKPSDDLPKEKKRLSKLITLTKSKSRSIDENART